ncbi:hypothetical protein AGMMS49992_27170 [Clostridia bacterium]|nr:hypothetical protein AGMMS49992_27170 [Clostridia bacterium]
MNFIHISDIHFGKGDFTTLRSQEKTKELCNLIKENGISTINSLVVTGDLIYARNDKNRNEKNLDDLKNYITEILAHFSCNEANLYIVPGNHDIERDNRRKRLCNTLRQKYNHQEGLREDAYTQLSIGFNAFSYFINSIYGYEYDLHTRLEKGGDYNYLLINTALICAQDLEDRSLIVDIKQIQKALKQGSLSIPTIALGHHPVECIRPEERSQLLQLFADYNVKMYLCGHDHAMRIDLIDPYHSIYQCQCGTLMSRNPDGSDTDMMIYAGMLDNQTSGQILAIKWDRRFNTWMPDGGVSYANNKKTDGIIKIGLSEINDCLNQTREFLRNYGSTISKEVLSNYLKRFSCPTHEVITTLVNQKFLTYIGRNTYRIDRSGSYE